MLENLNRQDLSPKEDWCFPIYRYFLAFVGKTRCSSPSGNGNITVNTLITLKDRSDSLLQVTLAFGKYARLLELTAPINKAYAKIWNHDIVILQGTAMILPWDKNCTPPEERSRFNKIDLLLEALKRENQYDQLLLLDADTLIFDFDFDMTKLVPNTTMLVAQRTQQIQIQTWINS